MWFSMKSAPKNGNLVHVVLSGGAVALAHYKQGKWLAPQMVGRPELGEVVINPISWFGF